MINKKIKFLLVIVLTIVMSFLVNVSEQIFDYINFENVLNNIKPKIVSMNINSKDEELLNVVRRADEYEEIEYDAAIPNNEIGNKKSFIVNNRKIYIKENERLKKNRNYN